MLRGQELNLICEIMSLTFHRTLPRTRKKLTFNKFISRKPKTRRFRRDEGNLNNMIRHLAENSERNKLFFSKIIENRGLLVLGSLL